MSNMTCIDSLYLHALTDQNALLKDLIYRTVLNY